MDLDYLLLCMRFRVETEEELEKEICYVAEMTIHRVAERLEDSPGWFSPQQTDLLDLGGNVWPSFAVVGGGWQVRAIRPREFIRCSLRF